MPDLITKILSIKKKIEIRQLLSGGVSTRIKDAPKVVQKGQKEIERLEVNKASVVRRDGVVIRAVQHPQQTVRMVNYGPHGAKGDTGEQGPKGDPGSIDNFVMDDLATMFRARLA